MLNRIKSLTRTRLGRFLSTLALAGALYSCGESTVKPQCQEGEAKVCTTGLEGVCSSGLHACLDGKWSDCYQNNQPSQEICDNLDNDCDGQIDNGNLCDDNLYCNGEETCQDGTCQPGTAVDCSPFDLPEVNTCNYNPDNNSSTLDFANSFTSTCNEELDRCTSGDYIFSHVCDPANCTAECATDLDCPPTECDSLDECVGKDFYDYHNVDNSCQDDCGCTTNLCTDLTITENDPRCTACQTDEDCNSLDNNYCTDTKITHDEGKCFDYECIIETTTLQDCHDNLYCNGEETCQDGTCQPGTAVDCSAFDLPEINTCNYEPDHNSSTLDTAAGFTSTCEEQTDSCTTSTYEFSHSCNTTQCGAECATDTDCPPTDCDTLDGCVDKDYYDYQDVSNACLSTCACETNSCANPIITIYDPRCLDCDDQDGDLYGIGPDCLGPDCNDNNPAINPEANEDLNSNGCDPLDLDGQDNNCNQIIDEICMVSVPAGTFRMGCDAPDPCEGDDLGHDVTLTKSFQIDKFETTNKQYQACVADGACQVPFRFDSATHDPYYTDPAFNDFPVLYVEWYDARDFCAWAGKQLPTEAQWEYTARSADGRRFTWGHDAPDCNMLNYNLCVGDTTTVGSYPTDTSPFGAMDLAGNLMEWVQDWYAPYPADPQTDPSGPPTAASKVLRGGIWSTFFEKQIYTYERNRSDEETTTYNVGFRCLLEED